MANFFIERQKRTTKYYSEDLGNGIKLDMVLIPEGDFMMGAPQTEIDSPDIERPQHPVTVATFFIGRYPVTQEQWRIVATLSRIDRKLEANPSIFKGDRRPVNNLCWYDAVEFCARLSQHTKREYRLPSEAEWEYACRAGTTTPFHFGETITTDLANYRGTDDKEYDLSGSYGKGPKGKYRQETTPVGSFPANNFGLCDMHGNVWEWCEDNWHNNYQDTPKDVSSWTNPESSSKVIRGGSWDYFPDFCRSATRSYKFPDSANDVIGFRVVCTVPIQ